MTHDECDCAETRTNATCDVCEPKSKSQLRREEIMNKQMTHDELLKEIDFELRLSDYDTWREGAKALRAVVELSNKPVVYPIYQEEPPYGEGWNDAMKAIIQAIQKELKR